MIPVTFAIIPSPITPAAPTSNTGAKVVVTTAPPVTAAGFAIAIRTTDAILITGIITSFLYFYLSLIAYCLLFCL